MRGSINLQGHYVWDQFAFSSSQWQWNYVLLIENLPSKHEFYRSYCCITVGFWPGEGKKPVWDQAYSDLPFLQGLHFDMHYVNHVSWINSNCLMKGGSIIHLIFLFVQSSGRRMGEELMVAHGVRLPSWIPRAAISLLPGRTTVWRKYAPCVARNAEGPGFIERDPVLHSIPELSEADFSIIFVVISAPVRVTGLHNVILLPSEMRYVTKRVVKIARSNLSCLSLITKE